MKRKQATKDEWKWTYLYRMFSHHTLNKEKENYVVNAIWARLDDLSIKPVTQQYVRRTNGSYALIDLYFPQINYGIECDEAYHKTAEELDAVREVDLKAALSACGSDLIFRRVDATQSTEDIHKKIREIVDEIKRMVEVQREDGTFQPWLSPEEEWSRIRKCGKLCVEDGYSFHTIADICIKCFGKPDGYGIQRSYFQVADDTMLWCPKLAVKLPDGQNAAQSKGWLNILSADWNAITESNSVNPEQVNNDRYSDRFRYAFAKSKDERGKDAYRFIGVFKLDRKQGDHKHRVYTRIGKCIPLTFHNHKP